MDFGLLVHREHGWLGGSPDGVTASGLLLECKCPLMRRIGDGSVPHHYWFQVQVCLEVCDLEEARFIQYRPASLTWPQPAEFVVTAVARDRAWFLEALPTLRAAHEEIQAARAAARATGELPPVPTPPAPVRRAKRSVECCVVDDLYGPIPQRPAAECAWRRAAPRAAGGGCGGSPPRPPPPPAG